MSEVLNSRSALGEGSAPSRRRTGPTVIIAVLAMAGTVFSLNQSLVIPALPQLQSAFHTSQSGVTWIVTANLLSASVFTPILGRLGDMFGKQRMLLIAMLGLVIGTLVSAVAPSLAVMLIGRVIAGVAGGAFPLAFAIVRDEFPPERVPGSIGIVSSLLGIGGGLGGAHHRSVGGPLAVLDHTLGLLAIGIAGVAGWIQIELRSRIPLIDMGMMRLRGVLTANLAALLLGAGMYGLFSPPRESWRP